MSSDQGPSSNTSKSDAAPRRAPGRGWRPAGWSLGLPALALLGLVAVMRAGPAIEHDLRHALIAATSDNSALPLSRYRAKAEIGGRDVTIVADLGLPDEARAAVERVVAAVPGIRSVTTEIAVPVALAPFWFTARRDAAGVTLLGGVPSAELRAGLLRDVTAVIPADSIDDRLRLATGAPPGFEAAARAAIRAILRASSGEIRLSDRAITVLAKVETEEDYGAVMRLVRAPPAGFTVRDGDVLPPIVSPWIWSVRRDESGLVLEGLVPSEEDRTELLAATALMLPGAPVQDRMLTARGLSGSIDFATLSGAAIRGLAGLRSGRAEFAGEAFRLSGETVERLRVAELTEAIRRDLPKPLAESPIEIVVVPAKPFVFTARRAAGLVVLSGYEPDDTGRRAVLDLARAKFPGERLVDQLRIADGAPSGFLDAQRAGLEKLADFAEGEAVLRDTGMRLSGRILYRQLAERMRETGPRSAPAGWSAEVAVETAPNPKPLDAAFCQDLLGDATRRDPVRFDPGSAQPSGSGLAELSDIVGRCGAAQITVTHRIVTPADLGEAQQVAAARASAIVKALGERGLPVRLSAAGIAASGKAESRTDFSVEP